MVDPDTRYGRLTFSRRLLADVNLEKCSQGVQARFPGVGTPTALSALCNDYGIVRGPNESNTTIARRLSNSLIAWKAGGSRRGVLEQVYWFMYDPASWPSTDAPLFAIVGGDGAVNTWDTLYVSSDPSQPTHAVVSPANFVWDGLITGRRAWLVIYEHLLPTGESGTGASISGIYGGGFCSVTIDGSITSAIVGQYITLSGAATTANNGTFQIVHETTTNTFLVSIPGGVAPDAHNGAILWTIGRFPSTSPAPVCGTSGLTCGADTSAMQGEYANAVITCGLTNPPDLTALVEVVKTWKSASTWYPSILFSFGGGDGSAGYELNPNSTNEPNGTWGQWPRQLSGDLGRFVAPCDGTHTYYGSVPIG
jgi:hypothetical protein